MLRFFGMLLIVVAFQLMPDFSFGQIPEMMSYQAVVRDASGSVMPNKSVAFRISILSGSSSGANVYSEVQKKTTNSFGLVDFIIGDGTSKTGSFETIDWSANTYFVRIELDPDGGTTYKLMGTSQLMSVPYALHAKTVEIDNVDDADADPANEIQILSKTGNTVTLSKNGGSFTDEVDDADADPANEIQTLSKAGNTVTLSKNGGSFTDAVDDADADPANEIQTLTLSGTNLTLSKNGGSVTLPSSGGGDNWGTQSVITDATLSGSGTTTAPLKIADNGVTLSKIVNGAVTTEKLADGAVIAGKVGNGAISAEKLADGAVTTNKISGGAVDGTKIAQQSATNGQVLKWNGSTWAPGDDEKGTSGLSLPYNQSGSFDDAAFSLTNSESTAIEGTASRTGVHGLATTTDKVSFGVLGENTSPLGYGISGFNTSSSGEAVGVFGKSLSEQGIGIVGEGNVYGVKGISIVTGLSGEAKFLGVRATSKTLGPSSIGLLAETSSPYGQAVLAVSNALNGSTVGVMAFDYSDEGSAVRGYSGSRYGTGKGISGNTDSPDGYSGYFTGGQFYVDNKIGIGIERPQNALDIVKDYASIRLKSTEGGTSLFFDQAKDQTQNNFSWLIFKREGMTKFHFGMIADQLQMYNEEDKGLCVKEDGSTRVNQLLTLDEGVRLGIGTSTPGAAIHVKGAGFPNSFIFLEGGEGNDAGFRLYEADVTKWHIYNNAAAGGLNICNANFTTAIFCKQSNSFVGINTMNPNYTLEVNGTAGKVGGGSWSTSSDIRLKKVQGNYKKGLNEISALQPILFTYKEGNARKLPSDQQQIGFVAQDVQKVFPEAVSEAADGYLDFNMHAINVALVNAVKELKAENDKLRAENKQIEEENSRIKAEQGLLNDRLAKLEELMEK